MWKKSGPLVEKVDLLEARGGSYEPLEPPLRTPMPYYIMHVPTPFPTQEIVKLHKGSSFTRYRKSYVIVA